MSDKQNSKEAISEFEEKTPNAETLEAMKNIEEGKNLHGPFKTVKELMDYLNADDDE